MRYGLISLRLSPIQAIHSRPLRLSQGIRRIHDTRFSPLVPPDPKSLPKPRSPTFRRKRRAFFRFTAYTTLTFGTLYYADKYFNASSVTRSVRTFSTALLIGIDYKINFRAHPPFASSIEDVHNRNARRVFELIRANGGLYLKIGQAIAMQSAVLPPEFQKMFGRMFDDAPQNDWADVEKVLREDFGMSPEEMFGVSFSGEPGKGVMEKKARASASVAQVHWARLADGREVAIKIQKREIAKQLWWDLSAFQNIAKLFSWWFEIPFYSLVPSICERLQLETDFENEANNSEQMKAFIQAEPRLRDRVYIPIIYKDLSSKRVLVAEWIEGSRLWDKEAITNPWYGQYGTGSPGAGGAPLKWPASTTLKADDEGFMKPDRTDWRQPKGKGGLGLSFKSIMTTMVDLFSAQMFLFGLVHCDPHPGNIFVRRLPSGKAELVLIDHGLYISMTPEFRRTWSELWKALIGLDNAKIIEIVKSWGIDNPDIFASMTLMRPYDGGDGSTARSLGRELKGATAQERAYEMHQRSMHGIKQVLGDETKLPRELIFILRNLRIVQGNNQFLGSPVNRIKITGLWASRSLVEDRDLALSQRVTNLGRHLVFRFVLLVTDIAWWTARFRQMLGFGGGMEDELEARLRTVAKDFGVELQHGVFDG
ncbi:ABC1-domain-containing protein [Microthyrium microscopicum]|uniref:ABC1-domain-containing protein n=1 Tax=Microthyrium microscopicum TaxID=703497 RepID=A0A6A6UCT4_9PEZI|nr:ABC1-domain-containing protein [Microthyrium microscopicum]